MSFLDYTLNTIWNIANIPVKAGKAAADTIYDSITDTEGDKEDKIIDEITPDNAPIWSKAYKRWIQFQPVNAFKEGYIQDITSSTISDVDKYLPQEAIDNGISSIDIALYNKEPNKLDEDKKNKIEELGLQNSLNTQALNSVYDLYTKTKGVADTEEIREKSKLKNKYYNLTEQTLGTKLKEGIKKGILDKEQASQLFRLGEQYADKGIEFEDMLKSNPEAFKNDTFLRRKLKERDELVKQYLDLLGKKVLEYNYDREKIENDDDLFNLGQKITDLDESLKMHISGKSARETSRTNPMKYARGLNTLVGAVETALGAGGRRLEEAWNKLGLGHLEQGVGIQQELGDNNVLQKFGNFITDITPGALTMFGGIGLTSKLGKLGTLGKVGERFATNEVINSVFNSYFDPALSTETKTADIAMDVIGDSIAYLAGKALREGIKAKALAKYGDDVIKIDELDKAGKPTGKTLEFKLSDLVNGKNLPEFAQEIASKKMSKDMKIFEKAINDTVDKLEKLDKKKSSTFTSLLVKEAKRNVIEGIAKGLEDIGQANKAKLLRNLATSSEGIDKVFKNIKESFINFRDDVNKLLNKKDLNLAEVEKLSKGLDTIEEGLAKSITKDGIKPEKAKLPTDDEVIIKNKIKNNEPLTEKEVLTHLTNSIGEVIEDLKKTGNNINFREFSDRVITVLEDNIGKLPKKYKKVFQNVLDGLKRAKGDNFFKDLKISFPKYIYKDGKILKGALGKHTNNKITISLLEGLYGQNLEDFFVVLFHELSHNKSYDFFRKVLTKKEQKAIDKIFDDFIAGFNKIKDKLPEDIRKDLERLAENKEEFLAYVVGEMIVKGKSDLYNRFVKTLEEYGVKDIEKDKLISAINKYVNNRFLAGKIDKAINYARKAGQVSKEGAKVIEDYLRYLIVYKDIKSVDDVIYNMTRDEIIDIMKELGIYNKEIKDIIKDMTDKELQDTLRYQIHMNFVGSSGFKAAAVWNAIGDILESKYRKGVQPNIAYLSKIIGEENVDMLMKAVKNGEKIEGKMGKNLGIALENLATTAEISTKNFNDIAFIWSKLLNDANIKPVLGTGSKENIFVKFMHKSGNKYDITDNVKGANELLSSMGYILTRKKNASKIKNAILNGEDDVIKKYKDDIEYVGLPTDINQIVEYNYSRFNAELAKYLNDNIEGVNKDLNKELYRKYNRMEGLIKYIGDNKVARIQNIGLPENAGRPIIYKHGDNIIYTDAKTGFDFKYNVKTGETFALDTKNKMIIRGLVDDRSSRAISLLQDIFSKESNDSYLIFKNKYLGCL